MASTTELINIIFHHDTETGDHRVGEVDFTFNDGRLNDFIARYGKDELVKTLAYFIYEVEKRFREQEPEEEKADAVS